MLNHFCGGIAKIDDDTQIEQLSLLNVPDSRIFELIDVSFSGFQPGISTL